MQWRALIVLLVGFSFIYAISLLQDTPYPQPRLVRATSDTRPLFARTSKPNEFFLSVVGDYLYLTATWFELGVAKRGGTQIKTGAKGYVRQYRRPFAPLITPDEGILDDNIWEDMFDHSLDGPISRTTSSPSGDPAHQLSDAYLTLVYHVIKGEEVTHMARVYFVPKGAEYIANADASVFHYRDFILPGTTWIDSIAWYNDSVIYSRDPDEVRFRALTFNPKLFEAQYDYVDAFKMGKGERGEELQNHQTPRDTQFHQAKFSKLYSSRPNTLRVVSAEIFQTSERVSFTITIVDNATIPVTESEGKVVDQQQTMAGQGVWRQRERISKYYNQEYEPNEFMGFVDYPSPYLREHTRISVPKLIIASSLSSTTVIIPINYMFLTLDYTTELSLVNTIATTGKHLYRDDSPGKDTAGDDLPGPALPELYLCSEQLPMLEGNDIQITGVELNAEGSIAALRTQYNDIVIYKRGFADPLDGPRRLPSVWELLDERLDIGDPVDALAGTIRRRNEEGDPSARTLEAVKALQWRLRMVIKGEWGGVMPNILAMKLWNATKPGDAFPSNYLITVRSDGSVTSYLLESTEPELAVGLLGFVLRKWEMFIGMITVIAMFVFGEVHYHQI